MPCNKMNKLFREQTLIYYYKTNIRENIIMI